MDAAPDIVRLGTVQPKFVGEVRPDVPAAVGVPEITPEPAFRLRPAGSEPDVTDHEYGLVPPVLASVVL